MIASLTPMYLFNLIMGCSLMILNDDLASSPFVQYIIAACFGTILAFIWLAMALYRMVENMTKSTMPPFHPLLAPVSFLSTSYLFTGPMVRDRMLDMMVRPIQTVYRNLTLIIISYQMKLTLHRGMYKP